MDWRRCGDGDGGADLLSSHSDMRQLPSRLSDAVPSCGNGQPLLEVRSSRLHAELCGDQPEHDRGGQGSFPMSSMQRQGVGSHQCDGRSTGDGNAMHQLCVQPAHAHVRAPSAVLEDGQIQHHGAAVLSGLLAEEHGRDLLP